MKTRGLTIFLDSWLDRPSTVPQYLKVADVDECDYIVISHAHFDQLSSSNYFGGASHIEWPKQNVHESLTST